MDSPPKKMEASKIKALQFLAGSHFAWKLLDGSTQKEKQTEMQWPFVKCPLSSSCWLFAWRSLDSSVCSTQEEASSSELSQQRQQDPPWSNLPLTCSQQMGRAWGCIQAPAPILQPKALSEHVPVCLRLVSHRNCRPLSVQYPRMEVSSSRSGYSHQGRVPELLQCSCDSRHACIFVFIDTGEHYPSCSIRPTLSPFLSFRGELVGFFLFFSSLFFFKKKFEYCNNFIASDTDFSHTLCS